MENEYTTKNELPFPPYCLIYDHHGRILVAGGGGASKTGIPNQIVCLLSAFIQYNLLIYGFS